MDQNQTHMEDEETDMGNSFQKVYGWFLVVNRIAGNDFTKHEYIFNKKVMEVLNQLSFLIQYDEEQQRLMKKANGEMV